jgi:hypothetical protein
MRLLAGLPVHSARSPLGLDELTVEVPRRSRRRRGKRRKKS